MFGFNSEGSSTAVQNVDINETHQGAPTLRWVSRSPEKVTNKTTVIFASRDGKLKGRFDIPGTGKGKHAILFCVDGAVWRQLMIDHAPKGTMIEIIRPDNTSFFYPFNGV